MSKSVITENLISNGVATEVVLNKKELHWINDPDTFHDGDTTVPWCDVIKAHFGKPGRKPTSPEYFTVHYIDEQANAKWRHKQKIFKAPKNSEMWVQRIEESRKDGKAKHLLVVINPFGGQRQGHQIYQKTVAPLFDLADITTEVIVTDDAQHADRIADTYDFTTVDGLILVGGDGLFHMVVNRLMRKKQKENGLDHNDPEAIVLPLDIKIGMIPTGTGNGIHHFLCGVKDVETATLHIIKGQTTNINAMGVYERTESTVSLVCYAGLLFGYGFVSDILIKTEERRWMKTLRYPVTSITSLFSKKRLFDAEIEYQTDERISTEVVRSWDASISNNHSVVSTTGMVEQFYNGYGSAIDSASDILIGGSRVSTQTGAVANGWQKLEKDTYLHILMFTMELGTDVEEMLSINPSSENVTLILQTKSSAFDIIKMNFKSSNRDKEFFNLPFLKILHKVTAFRFQVIEKDEQDMSPARVKERERERVLDIDGQSYYYTCTNKIEVRIIPKLFKLFATLQADKQHSVKWKTPSSTTILTKNSESEVFNPFTVNKCLPRT